MTKKHFEFELPIPWREKKFEISEFGRINFLVGPNGSGKSQFAKKLSHKFSNSRILGTDRLATMDSSLKTFLGDHFSSGYTKENFGTYKTIGSEGSAVDTFILLEEQLSLRIQVEATLSHLFKRKISLDWDSGRLVPMASFQDGASKYRLDREECHGIRELLVLLTHLYHQKHDCLIIDEPELNLHPQYQSFFMQEVRRISEDPKIERRKVIFLITHSPFILDFKSIEDIKSVISFDSIHSIPKHLRNLDNGRATRISTLVPRINVYHKQLFFSDNPIFVEGILDAQMIEGLQNANGVSIASAGSCIIQAGGNEEVNYYLELCQELGKRAYFVYDLDSLFNGQLRACLKGDGTIGSFLTTAGVGNDFGKYCGELDRHLSDAIKILVKRSPQDHARLENYLVALGPTEKWRNNQWSRARVAVLTALSVFRSQYEGIIGHTLVANIDGRLKKIVEALELKNIFLLAGGALERYLPSYTGDIFDLSDSAKVDAVKSEILFLSQVSTGTDLANRYGDFFQIVSRLPGRSKVDMMPVLSTYLSTYIHEIQNLIITNPSWNRESIQSRLGVIQKSAQEVFTLEALTRTSKDNHREFEGIILIKDMLGLGQTKVTFDHHTNAGMHDFKIIPVS